MKKLHLYISLVSIFVIGCAPSLASAAEPLPASVVIAEVQPGTADNASQEFIELYNTTAQPIDLAMAGWRLEVASASATDWAKPYRTVTLSGTLQPGVSYVVASKYTVAGATTYYLSGVASLWFSAGLSASAGHVRLVYKAGDGATVVADEIEWSAPAAAQPAMPATASLDGRQPYLVPAGGLPSNVSLQRWRDAADSQYVDADNDPLDFGLAIPSPAIRNPQTLPVDNSSDEPEPDDQPNPPDTSGDALGGDPISDSPDDQPSDDTSPIPATDPNAGLLLPYLTELLPNPAAPQTDAADEFIELYNPNDLPFDASGYILEAGLTTKHRYTLPIGSVLAPQAYMAFSSALTGINLSNSGSQVWLFAPQNIVISTTGGYTAAVEGQAWAFMNNIWQWTTTPTPNAGNTITVVAAGVSKKASAATASVSKKPPAVKSATTGKVSAKTTAKSAKTTKTSTKKSTTAKQPATEKVATVSATRSYFQPGLLAVVALFALLYGAYEYRHDLANKFHQLRSYRTAGRKDR